MFDFQWKPYVSAAERRRKAEREIQKLKKKGHPVSPVVIEGRTIAQTFGASLGVTISNVTATSRIVYHVGALTCAMAQ